MVGICCSFPLLDTADWSLDGPAPSSSFVVASSRKRFRRSRRSSALSMTDGTMCGEAGSILDVDPHFNPSIRMAFHMRSHRPLKEPGSISG
jgi:hypothetical protein